MHCQYGLNFTFTGEGGWMGGWVAGLCENKTNLSPAKLKLSMAKPVLFYDILSEYLSNTHCQQKHMGNSMSPNKRSRMSVIASILGVFPHSSF